MNNFEVEEPILNRPYAEPSRHWFIRTDEAPELRDGRRPALVYPPRDEPRRGGVAWNLADGTLAPSKEYMPGFEMTLVNLIRQRVKKWQAEGYPGCSGTTLELLQHWQREGRDDRHRLFFAQIEAATTIIFLKEARADFRHGLTVPRDDPSEERQEVEKFKGFQRLACKMATGTGKTTVMGMLAAWSILNKVNDKANATYSDTVLIVCPNVTIRDRLKELDPNLGEASLYRTRDLVPAHLMKHLTQGRVIATNWHVFDPQGTTTGGTSARVVKAGREVRTVETINIGARTTTARGSRYLTLEDYRRQVLHGMIRVIEESTDANGNVTKAKIESVRYVESDTALVNRVLGKDGKKNILVMNDEAHHAYRIRPKEVEDDDQLTIDDDEDEAEEEFFKEATVWVDGLDRVAAKRGVNFCVDLSATPYYFGRIGQETNRPFPWVVSDFGLIDAIESGLVKVPQLAVRDNSGADIPGYFNIWDWIMPKLTTAERGAGARKGNPKPEAILKYADVPIRMLTGLWEKELAETTKQHANDPRPPVFILVCKNTRIAKVIYEWLAEDKPPANIPSAKVEGFRNRPGELKTIRVDSKVVTETDSPESKDDEKRWLRFTLDTVGRIHWPTDPLMRPIYPEGFEALATKLERPMHPPGRDIRCIVSVAMLTEGWDCNTVTHVVGLRPFQSQLLCEQVVGRGLRRRNYEVDANGLLTEEVATIFGVPFEVIPFKATKQASPREKPDRKHVKALPARSRFEIKFPRVEGYTQAIRNRVTVDWPNVATLELDPNAIPAEVELKGLNVNNQGRLSLSGPGRVSQATLLEFRAKHRMQELTFDLATSLTRDFKDHATCDLPAHVLFPQLLAIVTRYVNEKVVAPHPSDPKDLFLSPYYGWLVERLLQAIRPDASSGETPEIPRFERNREAGSTAEIDYWSSRQLQPVTKSHVPFIVADTGSWEQQAGFAIDTHDGVEAFVKNAGLGFAIPYFDNGQTHEYIPDFLIRLKSKRPAMLILEVKGYDPKKAVKRAAAERWVAAVNAEASYGVWMYSLVEQTSKVKGAIDAAITRTDEV